MIVLEYVWAGVLAVIAGPAAFEFSELAFRSRP